MTNAFRFIRFSVLVLLERRGRHRASAWPKICEALGVALGGLLVLAMPAWMILLGVI